MDLGGQGHAILLVAVLALAATTALAGDAGAVACRDCLRIQTEYVETPAPARRAFSYVERIWAAKLTSEVPVRIRVTFRPLRAKASTIPNPLRGFQGAPDHETWYPSALADSLAGLDQDHDAYDMEIFFSSSVDWYYGTDGMVPEGLVDFVSVALHEVSHGLGFASRLSMRYSGALRGLEPGQQFPPLSFELPDLEGLPTAFDRFIECPAGQRLMEIPDKKERSISLGNAVLEGRLYFGGEKAVSRNGGRKPLLSASDPSHVHQKTYQWSREGLMTPKALRGRAIHEPGQIVLGVLEDLGWNVRPSVDDPGGAAGPKEPRKESRDVASMWTFIH